MRRRPRRAFTAIIAALAAALGLVALVPVSAASAAGTLTGVTFSTSSPLVGATGTTYTFVLTLATTAKINKLTMTLPSGTGGTPSGATASGVSQASGGYALTLTAGTPTRSGTTLTVPLNSRSQPAGGIVTVTVNGLTNTSTAGDYTSVVTTLLNSSTVDTGTSSATTIAAAALTAAYWWPSSATTSATGTTANFRLTTATTATLVSVTIDIAGIGGSPTLGSVSGLPAGGAVSLSGSRLTYAFGATSVVAGTVATLTVGGMTNPPTGGSYSPVIVTRTSTGPVDGTIANAVSFAGTAATGGSWTASSTTVGASGVSYTYGFTTGSGATTDHVTFAVPPDTIASSLTIAALTINPGYAFSVSGATAALSGGVITLSFTSVYINAATWSVTFSGITNTSATGAYGSPIAIFNATTVNAAVVPATITFASATAALGSVSWTTSSSIVNATGVSYTISAVLPSAATLTQLTMDVPADTAGTPTVGSVSPAAIAGGTALLSGGVLSYTFAASALATGTAISITFNGITNTATLQSVASSVNVLNGGTNVGSGTSNGVTFTGTALGSPTWSADATGTGATGVSYTATFTIGTSHQLDKFTMTMPAGTGGTPSLTTLTAQGPGTNPFSGGAVSMSGTTLSITFTSAYIQSGWIVTVVVGGLTNTATAGGYTSSIVTYDVAHGFTIDSGTTTNTVTLSSTTITGISWSASNSVVNTSGVTYTYTFGLSATSTVDTVTMIVPAGTAGTPTLGTITPAAIAGGTVSLSGTTLTYAFPSAQSIGSTTTVHIEIGGLTNTGTAGTYQSAMVVKHGGSTVASGTSPNCSFTAAQLSNPSWASTSQSTNIAASYTFGLTTTAGTYTSVTFTVPSGTTGTPTLGTISAYDQYGSVTLAGTGISRVGTILTFSFNSQYLQPGTAITVVVGGLTNTGTAGSYSSTITTYNGANPQASAATSALAFSSISVGTASWASTSAALSATGVSYTFGFTISATASVSSITMTVPSGTAGSTTLGTVSPAAIAGGTLSRSGDTFTYAFTQASIASGQLVNITINGITNTSTAGTYSSNLTLYDSNATIIASGSTTSITLSSSILTGVSWSLSSGYVGQTAVHATWQFTAATTNSLSQVTMTVPNGTGGAATLVSATTSPAVTLAGAAVSLNGTTLTLSFTGVQVPSGTAFTVEVAGLTNTTTPGNYSSSVVTRSSGTPRDSGVTGTASIAQSPATSLGWALSNQVAGTQSITETFSFTTSTSATIDAIVVALPGGTSGTPALAYLTPAGIGSAASLSFSGSTLTISFPATLVAASTAIALQVSGLTETSAPGAYVARAQTTSSGAVIDTALSTSTQIAARTLTATIACTAVDSCQNLPSGGTQLTILLIPGLATPVTAAVALQIATNAPYGYVVSVQSTALTSGSDVLPEASVSGEATIVPDRFGASATLTPASGSGAALCGAYAGAAAQIGYSGTATSIWQAAASTGAGSDSLVLTSHLRVSAVQPAGLYTGTISYTVVPRYGSGSGC